MWERSSFNPGQRPLFYIGMMPVYITTMIILVHIALLIVAAIGGSGGSTWSPFTFQANEVVEQGKLWKLVTYAFYSPAELIFSVAIGLVFFYLFGIHVEKYLGSKDYLKLYGVLLIVPPVVFSILYLLLGRQHLFPLYSSRTIYLSIFLAFAFIFPNAQMLFGFLAKWMAAFVVAVYTLQLIAFRDGLDLFVMWFRIILTYVTLRRLGLSARFPAFEDGLLNLLPKRKSKGYWSSKRKLKVVKGGKKKKSIYKSKLAPMVSMPRTKAPVASVDHLLEKISKTGIGSLTEAERKELESASSELSDNDEATL